jgi:hypothetical protein
MTPKDIADDLKPLSWTEGVLSPCQLCGKPFKKTRSFMRFCSGECRDRWNHNHYCGHGRRIGSCIVEGCEAQAIFVDLKNIALALFPNCNEATRQAEMDFGAGGALSTIASLRRQIVEIREQFTRCRCGIWFARAKGKKHCSARCRAKAKHEAEKARNASRRAA